MRCVVRVRLTATLLALPFVLTGCEPLEESSTQPATSTVETATAAPSTTVQVPTTTRPQPTTTTPPPATTEQAEEVDCTPPSLRIALIEYGTWDSSPTVSKLHIEMTNNSVNEIAATGAILFAHYIGHEGVPSDPHMLREPVSESRRKYKYDSLTIPRHQIMGEPRYWWIKGGESRIFQDSRMGTVYFIPGGSTDLEFEIQPNAWHFENKKIDAECRQLHPDRFPEFQRTFG